MGSGSNPSRSLISSFLIVNKVSDIPFMPAITLYLKVHQPYRLRKMSVFDIGTGLPYFEGVCTSYDETNASILKKVARKSYLPTNNVLLNLLQQHKDFKISMSLSGLFIEQLRAYTPEVLTSFKKLVKTGRVELLGETYYHSLAFLRSPDEFRTQVKMQERVLQRTFGVKPTIFSNTEAAYNNYVGDLVSSLGYKGIITEGADRVLHGRTPNHVYQSPSRRMTILLKNYKLSDDVAFRFSEKKWKEYPLTVDTYVSWINRINGSGEVVNLCMDYETFGEHQWEDSGIFAFLRHLPGKLLEHPDNRFTLPSESVAQFSPRDVLDVPDYITWADTERDLSAWQENAMQKQSFDYVYKLEQDVLATKDEQLIDDWRRLQTSDHFYYMCTKWFEDGDVHKYFNPYESPYEAFINFMNAYHDLKIRVDSYHDSQHQYALKASAQLAAMMKTGALEAR